MDEAGGTGDRQDISEGTLYIWLESEPGVSPPDVTIADEPGVNDNDQIADAIRRGDLGRFLPVTIRFADYADPSPKRVRSLDTARLLRDRHIRHRRRYEVMTDGPHRDPEGSLPSPPNARKGGGDTMRTDEKPPLPGLGEGVGGEGRYRRSARFGVKHDEQ